MPEIADYEPEVHVALRSIGGSDVACIMGTPSYNTPIKVWERIMALVPPRGSEPETGPLPRGKALESHAAAMWSHRTGRHLAVCPGPIRHPIYPMHGRYDRKIWAADDPTFGIPGEDGILEVKVLGAWSFKTTKERGIDPEYMWQLQHYLGLTGCSWGAFAVMNPDLWDIIDPHLLVFPRNEEMIRQIEETVVDWWQRYVVAGVRPPLTADDTATSYPRAIVGGEEQDWTLNNDFNLACAELKRAREQFGLAEYAKKRAEDRVKSMMGEHEVCRSIHGKISWKQYTQNKTDYERLLADNPQIDVSAYREMTTGRRFVPTLE